MSSFAQITLRTDRLLLRPLVEVDATALFAICSDPRVTRYLSHAPWPAIENAHALIAKDRQALVSNQYLRLGIQRTDDGKFIGNCSLFNLVEQCRRADLGYLLAFEAWGQGYMDEALNALLEFGFSQLALRRIEADIDPRNEASARSLERLGFIKEGHLRERWIVDGEVSDSALYGLLRAEWLPRQPGVEPAKSRASMEPAPATAPTPGTLP